jgi:hypothetical protein
MTRTKNDHPHLRVVDGFRDEPRRYAQSTSEHSDSQGTCPFDSRSRCTANASEHGFNPYATLRRWPKETLQRAAKDFRSETVIDFQKLMRSMAHSHRTVIENQSPSGDFTKWWIPKDNSGMQNPMAAVRRRNLARLIERDFGNNQSSIARLYNPESPKPSYFSDLLRGEKAFAEKAARAIEDRVGLRLGQLDIQDSPLLYDDAKKNSLKEELRAVIDDMDKDEQREALAALRKIQSKRKGRKRTGT